MIIGPGNRFLFAVNAGSNQISVLKIKKNDLTVVDLVNSGGIRPISLRSTTICSTCSTRAALPILPVSRRRDGTLTPLPDSTRPLIGGAAADPAQVGFSSDGSLLVVTEKAGNRINTYTVDDDGLPSAPIDNASNGTTPFGFAFNNAGTLVVSEAFGGAPNASAASSYGAPETGILSCGQRRRCQILKPPVAGSSSRTTENLRSSRIPAAARFPAIDVGTAETLALANSVAGSTGMDSAPIDMTLSNNSRYLFVIAAGSQSVVSFRVNQNGTLTMVDAAGGLPLGAQGIAAR